MRDHLSRAQVTAAGPRLEGILRHVVIRTTHDDREALVLLVVTRNDKSLRKPLRAYLAWEGRPDGLFVTVHDRDDPYMVGDVVLRIGGRTHIRETRLGPTYLLSSTAFFQTNLEQVLRALDADTVILTGVLTNQCVGATCKDALFRDFKPIVVEECVGTATPHLHDPAIEMIRVGWGQVNTLELTLEELRAFPLAGDD